MYLLLFAVAAMFYAVTQTVDHHYSTSVFKNLNPNFWNGQVSFTTARKIFGYPVDAFHLSMTVMVVICMMAAVFCQHPVWTWEIGLLKWYYQIGVVGIVWIIIFNIFFNKILVSTPKS